MKYMKRLRLCVNFAAFSLAEIAISMGIVTFSLVAILGILPVGLSTLREAAGATIEAQIVNQISSDVSQIPFHLLDAYATESPYYFDQEGKRVENADEALYWAEVKVVRPNYPGKPNDIHESLVNLQIRITSPQNRNVNRKYYNIFVARSDRNA